MSGYQSTTADAETLMRQASWTARAYLNGALDAITSITGEKHAVALKNHPAVIAAMISAAAADYASGIESAERQLDREQQRDASYGIGERLRGLEQSLDQFVEKLPSLGEVEAYHATR